MPREFGQLPQNMSPGAAGGCPAPAHSHCMLCQSSLEASPTPGCPLLPFPHTVHRADAASLSQVGENPGETSTQHRADTS